MMIPDRIEREILIDAPPEVVWGVVTDPEHVAGWFSDSAEIELRPGGRAILTWEEHGRVPGRVESVEPPRFFSFRWISGSGTELREDNTTLVEFTLSAEGDGTRLRVVAGRREGEDRRRTPRRLGARARRPPCVRQAAGRHITRAMSSLAAEADELLSAVADPTRRRVLDVLLGRGEATATMLAGELPVTRQAVAKQLAVLDRAGLVEGRRRGREVRYAVRPQQLDVASRSMAQVAAQWDRRLAAIKRIAEAAAREQEGSTHETEEVRR